jgi:hypothetical protein
VAKAYVDQLERSQALPAAQITALRQGIDSAESSRLNRSSAGKLKTLAATVEKTNTSNAADTARLRALVDVLRRPVL